MDNNKRFQVLLFIAVFTIATCGLIYELVAGALASYLLGDSVKQFSFIIGVYLFSMGIGSFFSKYIKKDLITRFIEIELLIGIIGGMGAVLLFLLFEYVQHFQVVLYLLVFTTGCLVGLEIPLLMNILKGRVKFSELVSNVFTFDYIGALLASILFPLVLVPKLGLMRTSLFFGMLNVSVAILLIFNLKSDISKPQWLKIKSFVVLLLLVGAFVIADKLLAFSEKKLYGENVIYTHTTPYQRIVLTHNKDDYRLYLNNNLQFSSRDEYRYHESLVHPAMSMAKNVDSVLVMGGGDGLAVREILKYPNVKHVTLVDLDEGMTKLFKTNEVMSSFNQHSLTNPRVTVINRDAFMWLKDANQHFDVGIIDFPDPSNYSLGKLYSQTFYSELSKVLNNDAVVSVQTTSPFFAPKSFWCIYQTISTIFPNSTAYHVYVPSFGEWGFSLFAKNMHTNFNHVYRKAASLKFYDYNFSKMENFSQDMKASNVEINRLDNQVLVRYFDEEWSRY